MFSASGIASGIDTGSLVRQLVSLQRQPIRQIQRDQSELRSQISDLGQLSSQFSELESLIDRLDTSATLLAASATSSDEDALVASASGEAVEGSWALEVSNLAVAEQNRSASFADSSAEVTEGVLTIEVWGEDAVDVTIEAGASLQQVRDAINASGANVRASILNTGAGSELVLTAGKSGYDPSATPADGDNRLLDASNPPAGMSDAVRLTETYTGAGGQALGLTQTIEAQNAAFSIDGTEILSTTNTVTEAVEGLSLELKAETSAPVRVDVTSDFDSTIEQFQEFVSSYNAIASTIDEIGETDAGFARGAKEALRSAVSQIQLGGSAFTNMSAVGIRTDYNTGDLMVDETKLREALETDSNAVANLFLDESGGAFAAMRGVVDDYTRSFDGAIALSQETIESRIGSMDDRIERIERRAEAYEERLNAQFTAMELFIAEMNDVSSRIGSFLPVG